MVALRKNIWRNSKPYKILQMLNSALCNAKLWQCTQFTTGIELSWVVYSMSLLNSQGLMSDGLSARQWDEGWKFPRFENTGFWTWDPVVWSRVFYCSTKRTAHDRYWKYQYGYKNLSTNSSIEFNLLLLWYLHVNLKIVLFSINIKLLKVGLCLINSIYQ